DGQIEIHFGARVEWTEDITDLAIARRLEPFHFWQDSEIEKRFRYDEKAGVSLAFVRVFRLSVPFVFPDAPKYGGCRSWVTLPDVPAEITRQEVLNAETLRGREALVRTLLR
ncbi:MAG TPA: DUF1802 family protein, partial [Chthoniobacteraceae bacterium]